MSGYWRNPEATVEEAAVVGVDHEELGQDIMAFIVPARSSSVEPELLAAWVAKRLRLGRAEHTRIES
ncbi:MAG: hypothetical protein CL908_25455 [Deltaproteobacteria bacterium]|jgi:acyl-coenzyme A synthetase/AMP-(fatty) acid ligase|nr:hypothetical protein [Deltaproteobacteria bacterium]